MPLVEIEVFPDPSVADIARGRLVAEGVDVILLGAGVASLGLGGIAPVRLMVDARDRVFAERLLAEFSA